MATKAPVTVSFGKQVAKETGLNVVTGLTSGAGAVVERKLGKGVSMVVDSLATVGGILTSAATEGGVRDLTRAGTSGFSARVGTRTANSAMDKLDARREKMIQDAEDRIRAQAAESQRQLETRAGELAEAREKLQQQRETVPVEARNQTGGNAHEE